MRDGDGGRARSRQPSDVTPVYLNEYIRASAVPVRSAVTRPLIDAVPAVKPDTALAPAFGSLTVQDWRRKRSAAEARRIARNGGS